MNLTAISMYWIEASMQRKRYHLERQTPFKVKLMKMRAVVRVQTIQVHAKLMLVRRKG